jgi:trans-aconitate 2-methyltransferase
VPDAWDPGQYLRFRAAREPPFRDLLALVRRREGMRVADLGCGSGDLTAELHRELGARETVGIDSSAAMLAKAEPAPGLRFVQQEIAEMPPDASFDLLFSNSALHWLPDHGSLLERLTRALAPGGQIAVQIPANDEHVSHQTAYELAREHEFKRHLGGYVRRPPLPDPAQYASWLYHLGYEEQHVRLQIYTPLLGSRDEVIEWNKGALLTDYRERLPPFIWEKFLRRYRELLLPRLPDERPFLYTYPRILLWGRLAGS